MKDAVIEFPKETAKSIDIDKDVRMAAISAELTKESHGYTGELKKGGMSAGMEKEFGRGPIIVDHELRHGDKPFGKSLENEKMLDGKGPIDDRAAKFEHKEEHMPMLKN